MAPERLTGVVPPVLTPLTADRSLDVTSYENLIGLPVAGSGTWRRSLRGQVCLPGINATAVAPTAADRSPTRRRLNIHWRAEQPRTGVKTAGAGVTLRVVRQAGTSMKVRLGVSGSPSPALAASTR